MTSYGPTADWAWVTFRQVSPTYSGREVEQLADPERDAIVAELQRRGRRLRDLVYLQPSPDPHFALALVVCEKADR